MPSESLPGEFAFAVQEIFGGYRVRLQGSLEDCRAIALSESVAASPLLLQLPDPAVSSWAEEGWPVYNGGGD